MNHDRLNNIREIVQSSRDIKSFYECFVTLAAEMSKASAGVAWDCNSDPFHPICQIQAQSAPPLRLTISEQEHQQLLIQAAKNHHSTMVRPSVDGPIVDAEAPDLMFGPIRRDSKIELVELIFPHQNDPGASRLILDALDEYCGLASQFEETTSCETLGQTGEGQTGTARGFRPLDPDVIDQYAHLVHGCLDDKRTASTIANEARRVLDCDRVSVAIRKGSKFRLLAISGQPSVNRRSNTVLRLSQLTAKVLATEQPFWYPTDDRLPLQIEKPLNEYLGFSSTRSLVILPIFDQQLTENNDPIESKTRPRVIAGLIVEQCAEQWNRERVAASIETVHLHASDAMRNALDHRQLFGYRFWRLLGKSKIVTATRNLPKTLAVTGGLALVIAALTFVRVPFSLHSDGLLLPQARRKIFAQIDGQVSQIDVLHGSAVARGDSLLQLVNTDLLIQIEEITGQIASLDERLEGNQTLRLGRFPDDQQRMQENTKALKSQSESLVRRKATLLAKLNKLAVTSPIAGEIITWGVADRLRDRPVKTGELLLEVADVDGEWEIVLDLPDRRIGHLLRELALRELAQQKKSGTGEGIKVTYQLAANPGSTYEGRIKSVAQANQLNADQEQAIPVIVEIKTEDIQAIRQSRSGVSAKIHCGYKPLGYVWFHDVFEFVQSRVLFRIW